MTGNQPIFQLENKLSQFCKFKLKLKLGRNFILCKVFQFKVVFFYKKLLKIRPYLGLKIKSI